MDLELELNKLLAEERYLDDTIKTIQKLKKRNGYEDCQPEVLELISKLKDIRKHIRKSISNATEELAEVAEVIVDTDFDLLD